MARKAYGDHATQVNLSNYPDDGTSPVGSAEWNEALAFRTSKYKVSAFLESYFRIHATIF